MSNRLAHNAWPIAIGALTGGTGAAIGARLHPGRRLDLGAVELAFIAGTYPAMAVFEGSRRAVVVECALGSVFAGVAVGGLSRRSRLTVALGLLGHAGWDTVHHLTGTGTQAPRWIPPFCMVADVLLALQFARSG